jgi:hypothetical protein
MGVIAATPADVYDKANTEQSPDIISVPGPDGVTIRLPPYANGVAPITLAQLGPFEIKAETLFPTIYQQSGFQGQAPRFAIRVVHQGQTVYQQRYSARQTSLLEALTMATRWFRFRRRQERWEYIGSLPVLSLWVFCMAIGWFLSTIVGWLSFLPLFVSIPFGWYIAPSKSKSPRTTASLGGFRWERNDFCRGWLITGDTGAGKTFAINALLHSVFRHEPTGAGFVATRKVSITKPSFPWPGSMVEKTTCFSCRLDRITPAKIGFRLPVSIFCPI